MTDPLERGLYEVLVTETLAEQLAAIEDRLVVTSGRVRPAEVADRIALHLGKVVERAIDAVGEDDRVEVAIAVTRDLIDRLDELVEQADATPDRPSRDGQVLRAITGRRPDGTTDEIAEPIIPLLDTTVLTNSPGEPRWGAKS